MSAAEIIDLSGLLSPIPGDSPTGPDLRHNQSSESPYGRIKHARGAARTAERSSLFDDGKSDEAQDNWRKILDLAPEIIGSHAKDLEVATWYIEALIRRHGFKGLRQGFTLLRNLIELFWIDLHPMPDEDGIDTRVAPLVGLNGEGAEGVLIAPIRNTLITESYDPGPFSAWQYKQALDAQKISDDELRERKIASMGFGIADIESAVSKSSSEFFIDLRDDLTTAIDEYRAIRDLLDTHCGANDSPPTSNIINTLEDVLSMVRHLGKSKFMDDESSAEEIEVDVESSNDETSGSETSPTTISIGPIRSRGEALKQLHNIAEYFQKTEPHSPIAYAIFRAIRWSDMPLDELIKELIPDSSSRDTYGSLTGLNVAEPYE